MADQNLITSADTIEAVFDEYIARYKAEYDRFEEVVGIFPPEVVNAGTAVYKYVVNGLLEDTAIDAGTTYYEKTRDTDVVTGKTYYTESAGVYTAVESPAKASLKDYYVAATTPVGTSSGRTYREGDEITLSHFDVTKVPLGEVNFIPYRFAVTAQAIQRGGVQNAFTRIVDKAYKQLRSDTVADIFNWLNLFGNATTAAPASGSWNLQQLLAYSEEKLLDTLETANENDTDIIHFLNRGDVYAYLAEATITTQDLFGMTYLENFLGVNKVFLTNRVTAGTVVATPVSNVKTYGIDYATLNNTEFNYRTDGYGLIGFDYDKEPNRASVGVYPVRTLTIMPEKEQFIVRGSMTPLV
jgi:hypothetical protein